MSRTPQDDIPEIFRRAMEEAGWREENKKRESEEGPPPPPPPRPGTLKPWWTNRWVWLLVVGLIFLASFTWLINTYTEWLWFKGVNYQSVWITQLVSQLITFAIFFILAALFLWSNWIIARRMAIASAPLGLPILRLPGIRWLITAAALFFAYITAGIAGGRYNLFLQYLNYVPFGQTDPIFNRDLSFYLFQLPVYRFLQGWLLPLIFLAIIGTVGIYLVNNLPRIQGQRIQWGTLPLAMRQHLALLFGLLLLLWAMGYWLNIYDLLYSPRGVVFGASYTDLNASLLALRVQMVLMGLLALAVFVLFFRADIRPVLLFGGLWLVATVVLGSLYPGLQQRYKVEPNELTLERPYIEYNIDFTRRGFDLDQVDSQPFTPITQLSAGDLVDNKTALRNIRLWDYRPLQQTYAQLQELRPYYEFSEVDIDRYVINGERQQVMLAARELEGLSDPTWVNEKLEFTHGFGIVMNPVDQVTREGRPEFYIKDLPPQSVIDIEITRPEVYYGEVVDNVVFVGSGLKEFSFPQGSENVYSSYEGTGGVPLGGFLQRLAFAIRFGDTNLLFSQYITPETRAMFHRQIQERVQRIAPFLALDHDPYIVVTDDGRLVWMQDAYTVSRDFPYSEPTTVGTDTVPPGINYIRNSVKITIDAYHGTVNFYLADPEDPLIQTYAKIFPDLFQPLSAMPDGLLNHIRYPEDLFLIQAQQYLTYHMLDVQVFYNREDLWEFPMEVFDGGQQFMEPYYVTFPLPGEEKAEYLLIQPYTPAGRSNMIAWIAARNDPEHYGEVMAYELPKQELVFGPIQVEGLIDQDPTISQQFSLWNQLGSRVIRGNLIIVPINQSFLYVEPIYLLSDTSALPELKRVIVASGNRIAMEATLDEALLAMLEGEVTDALQEVLDTGVVLPPAGDDTTTATTQTIDELIRSANDHFLAAEEAQRAGDWTTYGQELDALRQDLNRLMELSGVAPVPEPTPAATPTP